jgi:hypothetical protein
VDDVRALLAVPPLAGSVLAVDATGVGRPVVDMFRVGQLACPVLPVTITGGSAVKSTADGGWNVPKKELVGVLRRLLQTRRLVVAKALPDAAVLRRELGDFRVRITASAHETFGAEWRTGAHDDLVLAVALAAWLFERGCPAGGTRLPDYRHRTLPRGRLPGTAH